MFLSGSNQPRRCIIAGLRQRLPSFAVEIDMLWLIWIAIILLTPVLAGLNVWRAIRAQAAEPAVAEIVGEQLQA